MKLDWGCELPPIEPGNKPLPKNDNPVGGVIVLVGIILLVFFFRDVFAAMDPAQANKLTSGITGSASVKTVTETVPGTPGVIRQADTTWTGYFGAGSCSYSTNPTYNNPSVAAADARYPACITSAAGSSYVHNVQNRSSENPGFPSASDCSRDYGASGPAATCTATQLRDEGCSTNQVCVLACDYTGAEGNGAVPERFTSKYTCTA